MRNQGGLVDLLVAVVVIGIMICLISVVMGGKEIMGAVGEAISTTQPSGDMRLRVLGIAMTVLVGMAIAWLLVRAVKIVLENRRRVLLKSEKQREERLGMAGNCIPSTSKREIVIVKRPSRREIMVFRWAANGEFKGSEKYLVRGEDDQ